MNKLNLTGITVLLFSLSGLIGCATPETNDQLVNVDNHSSSINISKIKSLSGHHLVIDKTKVQHLVFMNIWDTYEGHGAELDVQALPQSFLEQSQQIWIQPEINVTLAQLHEFQDYYPEFTPIVLDNKFELMRALNVWGTPHHVLIKEGKKTFSGNTTQLLTHLNLEPKQLVSEQTNTAPAVKRVNNSTYKKLKKGDEAPKFKGITLDGKQINLASILSSMKQSESLNIVFLDALCPMPHFPGCEQKLLEVKSSIAKGGNKHWLGVMSSFYIDESIAKDFASRFALSFPIVFDLENKIFKQMSVHSAPYIVQLDSSATVKYRGTELTNL